MDKINKRRAITLIKKFIKFPLSEKKWYKKIKPYAKAIILYGSVAKGTNRKNSDIDFLIILPLNIEKKYTKGEYFYNFKGYEINIVLRSIEGLRKIVKEQKDSFQAEVFKYAVIIWEKDKEVGNLINSIKRIRK
jgi:predicted nucleotidyltransferase